MATLWNFCVKQTYQSNENQSFLAKLDFCCFTAFTNNDHAMYFAFISEDYGLSFFVLWLDSCWLGTNKERALLSFSSEARSVF